MDLSHLFKPLNKELESRTHILVKPHSRTLHDRSPDLLVLCLAMLMVNLGQEILGFALVHSDISILGLLVPQRRCLEQR